MPKAAKKTQKKIVHASTVTSKKKITIRTSKWLRGSVVEKSTGDGTLWCSDVQAGCCLGHLVHQISRVGWSDLEGKAFPDEVVPNNPLYTKPSLGGGKETSDFCTVAASLNDDHNISDKVRQNRLKKLFAKHGLELEFIEDEPYQETVARAEQAMKEKYGEDW